MQTTLFCGRCSGAMHYDAAAQRAVCARCNGKSGAGGSGAKAAPARRKVPLTAEQKAIKAEYAPARRAARFGGGHGVLVPEEEAESLIQTRIQRRLDQAGWMVVRQNSGAARIGKSYLRAYIIFGMPEMFASSGAPDLAAYKGSRFLFIEVKDRTGHLRDSQVRFIEHARKFGIAVHVCRSWQEAQAIVDTVAAREANRPTRAMWERLKRIEAMARAHWGEKLERLLQDSETIGPSSSTLKE